MAPLVKTNSVAIFIIALLLVVPFLSTQTHVPGTYAQSSSSGDSENPFSDSDESDSSESDSTESDSEESSEESSEPCEPADEDDLGDAIDDCAEDADDDKQACNDAYVDDVVDCVLDNVNDPIGKQNCETQAVIDRGECIEAATEDLDDCIDDASEQHPGCYVADEDDLFLSCDPDDFEGDCNSDFLTDSQVCLALYPNPNQNGDFVRCQARAAADRDLCVARWDLEYQECLAEHHDSIDV